MSCAASWIVGMHLLTGHAVGGFESLTPGAYVVLPCGVTAGVLRNSLGRASVYAGATWNAGAVAFTVGAITGYARPLVPLVLPSLRVPVDGAYLRVGFIPRVRSAGSEAALHLSIETSF